MMIRENQIWKHKVTGKTMFVRGTKWILVETAATNTPFKRLISSRNLRKNYELCK